MEDMAEQIAATQCFGLEYERVGVNKLMSVRFWKGDSLCRVFVCRSGLPSADLTGELGSLSRFLSVVFTKADIVACSSCPVELICTIDRCALFPRAVQSCFRFEHYADHDAQTHLQCVRQNRLFLRVEEFTAADEDWAMQSPELLQVGIFPFKR